MVTTNNKPDQHKELCLGLNDIYRKKNQDYGDSFSEARHTIPSYTLGKLYDKFSRFKHLMEVNVQQAVPDETVEDTLLDMANYCVMEVLERRRDAQKENTSNAIQKSSVGFRADN